MAYEQLVCELDGPVATVRLNNPAKLNALSETMTAELIEALSDLSEDEAIRAVLLTGEGRGFCVGADLGNLEEAYRRGERPRLSKRLRGGYNRLVALLAEAPKPVIAAVNGVTAGAGVSLMMACDMRIASEDAAFSMAFVKIGLVPDSGASYLLPRAIGRAKSLELAMTGEPIDASTARDLGMVSRVVPATDLVSHSTSLAVRLAEMPTAAIAMTKRLLRETSGLSLADTMEREAQMQDEAGATDDHLEGVLAFLDKRPPSFSGR